MNKYKDLGFHNKETGEDLEHMTVGDIIHAHKRNEKMKVNIMMQKLENRPSELSLGELVSIFEVEKINKDKIKGFSKYYQTNEEIEERLLDSGIKPNTYFHFKRLVNKLCSQTYTLQYKNNKDISNDSQIAKKLDISSRQWSRIKSELLKLGLLKEISWEGKDIYKVNPCYVGKKKILSPHTYHSFRNDLIRFELITGLQILYWDKYMLEEYNETYDNQNMSI